MDTSNIARLVTRHLGAMIAALAAIVAALIGAAALLIDGRIERQALDRQNSQLEANIAAKSRELAELKTSSDNMRREIGALQTERQTPARSANVGVATGTTKSSEPAASPVSPIIEHRSVVPVPPEDGNVIASTSWSWAHDEVVASVTAVRRMGNIVRLSILYTNSSDDSVSLRIPNYTLLTDTGNDCRGESIIETRGNSLGKLRAGAENAKHMRLTVPSHSSRSRDWSFQCPLSAGQVFSVVGGNNEVLARELRIGAFR